MNVIPLSHVQKASQSLAGILRGIAIDYEVTDGEVGALTEWLSLHAELLDRPPFDTLACLVERILQDGRVSEDEREELLDWCQRFAESDSVAVQSTTDAIRRLHGVLHGVAADRTVSHQEAIDLRDWLHDHDDVKEVWPFCDLHALLARVLADGRLDPEEQALLQDFCADFGDRPDVQAPGAVTHSLAGLCEHGTAIFFEGRTFCFTGESAVPRAELSALVAAAGGLPVKTVRRNLDYLVIGRHAQPAWAYAAYGRKVEAALALRAEGIPVHIVSEHHLLNELARFGANTSQDSCVQVEFKGPIAWLPGEVTFERRVLIATHSRKLGPTAAWTRSHWNRANTLLRIVGVDCMFTVIDAGGQQVGQVRRLTPSVQPQARMACKWLQYLVNDGWPMEHVREAAAQWTAGRPVSRFAADVGQKLGLSVRQPEWVGMVLTVAD